MFSGEFLSVCKMFGVSSQDGHKKGYVFSENVSLDCFFTGIQSVTMSQRGRIS